MKYLIFLAVLLCACAPQTTWVFNEPYSNIGRGTKTRIVMTDRLFSKEEQQQILRAIDEWNVALNKTIELDVIDLQFDMEIDKINKVMSENGIMILSVPSYGDVMRYVDDGTIGAKTDRIGGNVIYLLNDRIDSKNIFAFTLHEIGHVLGSQHAEHGLMNPNYHPHHKYCVDKFAVEQVAMFNGLNVNKMNYCVQQ